MSQINLNYLNLKENYLFAEIARKVAAFTAAHPEADVIRMGIGDVTRPLAPAVISAMQKATAEMGTAPCMLRLNRLQFSSPMVRKAIWAIFWIFLQRKIPF